MLAVCRQNRQEIMELRELFRFLNKDGGPLLSVKVCDVLRTRKCSARMVALCLGRRSYCVTHSPLFKTLEVCSACARNSIIAHAAVVRASREHGLQIGATEGGVRALSR